MRHLKNGIILAFACCLARAAAADPSDLCRTAAKEAAEGSGVPLALVRAVMTTESGRPAGRGNTLKPWPWALNVEGQGYWPETREQAIEAIDGFLREGRTSIDIGCFQINLRWHGAAFASAEDMIDPMQNAAYAVRFLLDLKSETGSWREAAGAYHSRNPDRAETYVQRLKSVHADLIASSPAPEEETPPPARAAFSLVRTAGALIDTHRARGPLIRRTRRETP
jgi:hypothetical protein